MLHNNRVVGGSLLIAGTCIGAGMLALPIAAASSGFIPSTLLLFISWLFMYTTGLLVVEVNLCLDGEPNYISMVRETLGQFGAIICWIVFLFLLYSLLAAYITGGGQILISGIEWVFHIDVQDWIGPIPWMLIFATVIYLGAGLVDFINRFLMFGLIISYAVLMTLVTPEVKFASLTEMHPEFVIAVMPVMLTSFGYHIIVPSMRTYLKGDLKKLRRIVLFGSLLPFVVYILWDAVVFGVIPFSGPSGLYEILKSGNEATGLTNSLAVILQNTWITSAVRFFTFFAIASSFLGVAFGLFDLLADGLKVKKGHGGRVIVALCTFMPPLIYGFAYPKGFILALGYAGVFVAILHGILPAVMAWRERYTTQIDRGIYRVKGGKPLLILIILFFSFVIIVDILSNLGVLPKIV